MKNRQNSSWLSHEKESIQSPPFAPKLGVEWPHTSWTNNFLLYLIHQNRSSRLNIHKEKLYERCPFLVRTFSIALSWIRRTFVNGFTIILKRKLCYPCLKFWRSNKIDENAKLNRLRSALMWKKIEWINYP